MRYLIAIIFSTGALNAAGAEEVGRVLLAGGVAVAIRDGREVPLALNSAVESKDILRTGQDSSLQVRFGDKSLVSIRENSEFVIEEFQFGKDEEEQKSFFRLVKGGFRAVSGLIGRVNHANYRVRTSTATIGIRGTDYAVRDCRGDCGGGVKDGLYGTVLGLSNGTNRVALTNNAGESVFGINQHFYVADQNSHPQPLLQPPSFVAVKPQGKPQTQTAQNQRGSGAGQSGSQQSEQSTSQSQGQSSSQQKQSQTSSSSTTASTDSGSSSSSTSSSSGTGTETTTGSTGIQSDSRPNTTTTTTSTLISAALPQTYQVTQSLTTSGTSVALPPTPRAFIATYPLPVTLPLGQTVIGTSSLSPVYNNLNQLTAYGNSGTYPAASLANGTITDSGSITLSNGQVFSWGRWSGNTNVTINDFSLGSLAGVNTPVLFGTATGSPLTNMPSFGGVATYSYSGGPRPVDAGGNIGTVTSSIATINFTQQVASMSLGMNFPTVLFQGVNTGPATFNVTGTAGLPFGGQQFAGQYSGVVSGTCTGSGCLSGGGFVSGTMNAAATGPNGYDLAIFTGVVFGTKASDVAFLNAYQNSSFTPGPGPGPVLSGVASGPSIGTQALEPGLFTLSGNNLVSFNTGFFSGAISGGTIVDMGGVTLVDGSAMTWGRWTGAQVTTAFVSGTPGTLTGQNLAFVTGNASTVLPTSGTFVYNLASGGAAGLRPFDSTGSVGTFNSGSFNVTFSGTGASVNVANPLNFSVGSVTYSLSSTINSFSTGGSRFMPLVGSCSGGGCSTGVSATAGAQGVFVGPQAGGFAVAGTTSAAAAVPTVTFAGAFKR